MTYVAFNYNILLTEEQTYWRWGAHIEETETSLPLVESSLLSLLFTAASFKAGKINVTTINPGLFACEKVSFSEPFHGGKEVKVFASFGHSVKNPTRGDGAAIWVESEDKNQFKTCISEYGLGSNTTGEVNWIAVQSAPSETQIGTTSLNSWTTGTKCKRIDFPQVSF